MQILKIFISEVKDTEGGVLPFAIFCAHPLRSVLPIMKLMHAAVVALSKTVKKPGIRPNKYPLEAASGITGILTNSQIMYTYVYDKNKTQSGYILLTIAKSWSWFCYEMTYAVYSEHGTFHIGMICQK